MDDQIRAWNILLIECSTLASFNERIVPLMKTEGDVFKRMAAGEAKYRGYKADKSAGVYVEPVEMRLTKGRNVIKVGWRDGVLHVEFASGAEWEYVGVPEAEFHKLLRVPFPDKLFASNIRDKFQGKNKAPSG